MNFLSDYSRLYDLFYKRKNYKTEARYIRRLIQKYSPGVRSLLELGCGTGKHASFLAGMGYQIHGVDKSTGMVRQAKKRRREQNKSIASRLKFSEGDIRRIRLNQKFDAVISLFHVMSYQITDQSLKAAVRTARHHLKPNGIFIFDCWYGPAVLAQPPVVKLKRFENAQVKVTRLCRPRFYLHKHRVAVRYELSIYDKKKQTLKKFIETHRMRYLFKPEVERLIQRNGFKLLNVQEWLTGKKPGPNAWSVCFVGRRNK